MRQRLKLVPKVFLFLSLIFLLGCAKSSIVVNNVGEREANEIIVFLASKGIAAAKTPTPTTGGGGEAGAVQLWSISVDERHMVDAMAILNRNGLPRKASPTLLDLFAKSGLVSSEREDTIRYQAGLAAQIAGTIRKIDGVIDADVELSIPTEEVTIGATETGPKKRVKAAVYVKHQGILDDPNSHLVTKIKRLVAGSVTGLDINDVTVIPDRSRFTDVSLKEVPSEITPQAKEYVSVWSIVMSKGSIGRFRVLFFFIITALIVLGLFVGWMLWKFYPLLRKRGLKNLFNPIPFRNNENENPPPPT